MKRSLTLIAMLLPFLFGGVFCGHATDEGQSKSKHGWLGVSTSDMTPRMAKSMHVKTNEGALVQRVMEDSPAEEAGIQKDDIIVQFNGTKISDGDDLLEAVRSAKPGTAVSVVVSRHDAKKTLKATLEKSPAWFAAPFVPRVPPMPHIQVPTFHFTTVNSMSAYGLSVLDLNRQLGRYFGAPGGRGVLVEEVEEGSSADSAGFQAGDVIVKIQNDSIAHTHDIWNALEDLNEGDIAGVEVMRRGNSQRLSLRVQEPLHRGRSFHFHSFEVPDFDRQEFEREMDRLQRQLRKMGREIESRTRDLDKKLREELSRRSLLSQATL